MHHQLEPQQVNEGLLSKPYGPTYIWSQLAMWFKQTVRREADALITTLCFAWLLCLRT